MKTSRSESLSLLPSGHAGHGVARGLMPIKQPSPACPLSFGGLIALADGCSAIETGALFRLVRFAWLQEPPCTLPDDDSSLAVVAGVTDDEWSRLRARLLMALAATHTAPPSRGMAGGSTGRLLLGHARRAYDELAAMAAKTAADKRAAGLASARARGGTGSTAVEQPLNRCLPPVAAAPSLRSSSLHSPTLHRSSGGAIQSAPPERSSDEDVIAVVGERARAILASKAAAWNREQSLRMLQKAISRWRADGLTTCPVLKAGELANSRHAEPARVESLIEEADGLVERERAKGGRCNPVGFVMHGLGESEKSRGRPSPIPLFVSERWAKLQAGTLQMLEAQAALSARLTSAREAALGPVASNSA